MRLRRQCGQRCGAAGRNCCGSETKRLHAVFEEYFEEYLQLEPLLATSIGDPRYNDRFVVDISPQGKAAAEKLHRDYLARIQAIDAARCPRQDRLSYEIFKSARERDLEGFRFPRELLPLNQFYSTTNTFVQLGSGDGCSHSRRCRTTTTS